MKNFIKISFIVFLFIQQFVFCQKQIDFAQLDNYISKAVTDFEATGLTISIVKDGDVVFKNAYGFKNAETGEKVTTASLFNIASCSKAFSSFCMGLLVEEGIVNWSDNVIDYLPEFQLADPFITREMNLVDILSHRSGLETFAGDLLWYETNYSDEEIIKRLKYIPIKNDFRSQFGYQNCMYIVAGKVIEKAKGISWSDMIYERIFKPLKMVESKTCGNDLQKGQDIALPHIKGKVIETSMQHPNPAGSIFSSVDEMSNWIKMWLNKGEFEGNKIISQQMLEELTSTKIALNVSPFFKNNGINFRNYAMGWFTFDYSGKKVIQHGGGMPGYISIVVIVPEENLGMVILTNDDNNLPTVLSYKILDLYLNDKQTDWAKIFLKLKKSGEEQAKKKEEEINSSRIIGTSPSLELSEYAGFYEDKMYGKAMIEYANGELKLTLLPAEKLFVAKMEHWHFDTFRIKFKDEFLPSGFVNFNFDSQRNILGFKIDLPNPDFDFNSMEFNKIER